LDGNVALTNDRFKKLFDKLMSVFADFKEFKADLDNKNKEERYSRVPRLSDTRYSDNKL